MIKRQLLILIYNTYNMNLKKIYEYIKEKYSDKEAKIYYSYVSDLIKDPKQKWSQWKDENYFIIKYEQVKNDWLVLDWKHITLWYNGISYDYVAYKNKMLINYPESIIDINLVYEWDEFDFKKDNWKIVYHHTFANPFETWNDKIKGGYCIIKNTRWEFITLLSKKDFELHRQVAKTDYIWKAWFKEMCMKTLFKKAIKVHYDDIFQAVEEEDNNNYDLNKWKEINKQEKENNLKDKYK